MRKKYFDREYLWDFIWNHADHDGMWNGNAELVAAEFHLTEAEARLTLAELCDSRLIERIDISKFAIVDWMEDEPGETSG
jgi:hypothetical protein